MFFCFSLDENVFYQMILRLSYLAGFLSDVFLFYQTLFFIRCNYFLSDVAVSLADVAFLQMSHVLHK